MCMQNAPIMTTLSYFSTRLDVSKKFQSASSMASSHDATDDLELVVQAPSRATSDSRQTSIDASISRSGPVAPKGFGDYFKTIGRFGLGFNQIKTARSAKAKLNRPNQAIQKLATSNKLNRHGLAETYEKPKSCREGWWRATIRETPNPGAYDTEDFLEELYRRPATYQFKSEGRKQETQRYHRGSMLLPGAYDVKETMADRLEKSIKRYTFLDTDRTKMDFTTLMRDKEVNVAPNAYRTEDHLAVKTGKLLGNDAAFKSQTVRFPTTYFKPKEGPSPGSYDQKWIYPPRSVCSSFTSRTPRFRSSNTRVPGPGTYEKTLQYPQPKSIVEMGRQQGIFFTSDYRM